LARPTIEKLGKKVEGIEKSFFEEEKKLLYNSYCTFLVAWFKHLVKIAPLKVDLEEQPNPLKCPNRTRFPPKDEKLVRSALSPLTGRCNMHVEHPTPIFDSELTICIEVIICIEVLLQSLLGDLALLEPGWRSPLLGAWKRMRNRITSRRWTPKQVLDKGRLP
jgi:hypothetical protein